MVLFPGEQAAFDAGAVLGGDAEGGGAAWLRLDMQAEAEEAELAPPGPGLLQHPHRPVHRAQAAVVRRGGGDQPLGGAVVEQVGLDDLDLGQLELGRVGLGGRMSRTPAGASSSFRVFSGLWRSSAPLGEARAGVARTRKSSSPDGANLRAVRQGIMLTFIIAGL